MKRVGTLKKVDGKVFSHVGDVYGKIVCVYPQKVKKSEKMLIMEPEERDLKEVEPFVSHLTSAHGKI